MSHSKQRFCVIQCYIGEWRKFFDFKGRSSFVQFICFLLLNTALLAFPVFYAHLQDYTLVIPVKIYYGLGIILVISVLSAVVRRYHDVGKSVLFLFFLLQLIPVMRWINVICLFAFVLTFGMPWPFSTPLWMQYLFISPYCFSLILPFIYLILPGNAKNNKYGKPPGSDGDERTENGE